MHKRSKEVGKHMRENQQENIQRTMQEKRNEPFKKVCKM